MKIHVQLSRWLPTQRARPSDFFTKSRPSGLRIALFPERDFRNRKSYVLGRVTPFIARRKSRSGNASISTPQAREELHLREILTIRQVYSPVSWSRFSKSEILCSRLSYSGYRKTKTAFSWVASSPLKDPAQVTFSRIPVHPAGVWPCFLNAVFEFRNPMF